MIRTCGNDPLWGAPDRLHPRVAAEKHVKRRFAQGAARYHGVDDAVDWMLEQ